MKGLLLLKTRAVLGGLIGLTFAALTWTGVLDKLEDLTVDYRMRLRKPQPVSDDVRLVCIGDRDLAPDSPLGPWPFARSTHGAILGILNLGGARHAAVDILFTEPSGDPEEDAKLNAAITEYPNVTLAYNFEQASSHHAIPAAEDRAHFLSQTSRYGLRVDDLRFVRGQFPVASIFHKAPATFGAVNAEPDVDGVLRRVPLFFVHQGRLCPSLAMQSVISFLGLRDDQINIIPGQEITLVDTPRGTLRIPIDENGCYRVNFLGDVSVFHPAYDYLNLRLEMQHEPMFSQISAQLKDRVALIGVVHAGHANMDVATSAIGRLPGVAVHATVVSNILTGNHLHLLPRWQQALLIILAGMLLGLSMWPARVWLGITMFVVMTAAWGGLTIMAANANIILPVLPVLASFGVATLLLLGVEAAAMKRDRSRVVGVLGRYIARPLLERLVDTDRTTAATTERRELTIFFSDIRGFTAWTERAEPDEVAARLNEYFAAMTPFIERHGGTLDKFIGDCVMVFFGAPNPDEKHALHAVQMAQDMQRDMVRLNENWTRRGYDPLHIGIGIHTGYVTVGSFGSSTFLDYTVIGRAVNLAARIESQAEGGKILISARTHSLVRDQIKTVPHPELTLKGIPEPQVVWDVVTT